MFGGFGEKLYLCIIKKEIKELITIQNQQVIANKGYKMSKGISKAILYVLILIFILGVSGADSLMENGKLWLLLLMVFGLFGIGHLMNKKGWLDWMNDEAIE